MAECLPRWQSSRLFITLAQFCQLEFLLFR
jgi:hypothetical protein